MLARVNTIVLSAMISAMLAADVFAQGTTRPPSGPQQLSLEKAWNWLMARPGVMIAIAVCIAAVAYMILANRRKKV